MQKCRKLQVYARYQPMTSAIRASSTECVKQCDRITLAQIFPTSIQYKCHLLSSAIAYSICLKPHVINVYSRIRFTTIVCVQARQSHEPRFEPITKPALYDAKVRQILLQICTSVNPLLPPLGKLVLLRAMCYVLRIRVDAMPMPRHTVYLRNRLCIQCFRSRL